MTKFHLHLVSDATGETLVSLAKAALVQFEKAEPTQHLWTMVRSTAQLDEVFANVVRQPGPVLFTFVDHNLGEAVSQRCQAMNVPCLPVMQPIMAMLADYLGDEAKENPGRQHVLDDAYFDRIDAIHFSIAHDDGLGLDTLHQADVILVGVSRTSKTPTCTYLANRGIKAANVPIVPGYDLPAELSQLDGGPEPVIVGLITKPDRLIQIRRNRLLSLNQHPETEYVDVAKVREEVAHARRQFENKGWPVIDVTRRSIEETAAAIVQLLPEK